MPKKSSGGGLKLYKSYSFREKDPIIDRLRTIIQDQHAKYKTIEEDSGVSAHTLYQWFRGPTRRPQFATVMAVARSLGYDLEIVDKAGNGGTLTMPSARSLTSALKLPKSRNGAAANH